MMLMRWSTMHRMAASCHRCRTKMIRSSHFNLIRCHKHSKLHRHSLLSDRYVARYLTILLVELLISCLSRFSALVPNLSSNRTSSISRTVSCRRLRHRLHCHHYPRIPTPRHRKEIVHRARNVPLVAPHRLPIGARHRTDHVLCAMRAVSD